MNIHKRLTASLFAVVLVSSIFVSITAVASAYTPWSKPTYPYCYPTPKPTSTPIPTTSNIMAFSGSGTVMLASSNSPPPQVVVVQPPISTKPYKVTITCSLYENATSERIDGFLSFKTGSLTEPPQNFSNMWNPTPDYARIHISEQEPDTYTVNQTTYEFVTAGEVVFVWSTFNQSPSEQCVFQYMYYAEYVD